jgi:hypothetical protein
VRPLRLLLILLIASSGCAWSKKDTSVCPEYRDQHCVAGQSCSMDATRACRVCQCDPMDHQVGASPPGIAPGDPSMPH